MKSRAKQIRLKRLTLAEVKAVRDLITYGWADYEACTKTDLKGNGFDGRWLRSAQNGCAKLGNYQSALEQRATLTKQTKSST